MSSLKKQRQACRNVTITSHNETLIRTRAKLRVRFKPMCGCAWKWFSRPRQMSWGEYDILFHCHHCFYVSAENAWFALMLECLVEIMTTQGLRRSATKHQEDIWKMPKSQEQLEFAMTISYQMAHGVEPNVSMFVNDDVTLYRPTTFFWKGRRDTVPNKGKLRTSQPMEISF